LEGEEQQEQVDENKRIRLQVVQAPKKQEIGFKFITTDKR
jgi:hypothetical protein